MDPIGSLGEGLFAVALIVTGVTGWLLFLDPRVRPGRWRWLAWAAVALLSLCPSLVLTGLSVSALLPIAMWESSPSDYALARFAVFLPGLIAGVLGVGLAVLATRSHRRAPVDAPAVEEEGKVCVGDPHRDA